MLVLLVRAQLQQQPVCSVSIINFYVLLCLDCPAMFDFD
jgi:hypothetical protein